MLIFYYQILSFKNYFAKKGEIFLREIAEKKIDQSSKTLQMQITIELLN